MSASSITRAGRRKAESLMVDSCSIRPVTGTTTNPDGTVVPTYGTPSYEGKCKLQVQSSYPQNPQAGEHQWTVGPLVLHLPVVGAENIATDDLVEITGSFDAVNVGRLFRVRHGDRKTFQSALRVLVEEVAA